MNTESIAWLIPIPPLIAFAFISIGAHRSRSLSHWLAAGAAGLSWLASMFVFWQAVRIDNLAELPFISHVNWLPLAGKWFQIGIQVDPLTAVALFFVSWTVLLIMIYSIGYHNFGSPAAATDRPGLPPHGAEVQTNGRAHRVPSIEPMYARFFAFLSLFAFAMLLLVITDNLLVLFVGWEIMGLCSYLLIGFWYAKPAARDAAVKAFLTTRVGDMLMLLGIAALFSLTGTLSYREILSDEAVLQGLTAAASPLPGLSWAGLIGLLLFAGTVGKSAQFPLHVWLPDAMEGPTPVSAMIHAAAMVSAGVYLAARFFPLLSAGWVPGQPLTVTMTVMALIGTFTAVFAALIALAQNDIKRVLAYSTISQLGYMVAALGIGAYVAAVFHLFTHAFFKALLFLGSGSVIHGMEHGVYHTGEPIDAQDMRNMGGLRRRMPFTFWTFLAGGLALAGFPLITAGFWSKDEILTGAFNEGKLIVFVALALAALLTAFYTMRQITLTFLGQARTRSAEHAAEARPVMLAPLVVLAFFALTAGWVGIPHAFPVFGGLLPSWMEEFLGSMLTVHPENVSHSLVPLAVSVAVSLLGLAGGWLVYRRYSIPAQADPLQGWLGGLYRWLQDKFYIDEVYQAVLVRPVRWLAESLSYRLIDQGLLDGIIHGLGRTGLWLGSFFNGGIDRPLINGFVDASSRVFRGLGSVMRRVQAGRVQSYMILSLWLLVIFAFVFVYFFDLI